MKSLTNTILFSALAVIGLSLANPAFADHGKGMHMMHHEGGGGWKAGMSEEQRSQLLKLKVKFKKKKYPLKAKIKQAKVDLALLMTSDKPAQSALNKQINKIVKIKEQLIQLKVNHKIAVRKLLNEKQRAKFDMKIMKKAFHGKKHAHRGHY